MELLALRTQLLPGLLSHQRPCFCRRKYLRRRCPFWGGPWIWMSHISVPRCKRLIIDIVKR